MAKENSISLYEEETIYTQITELKSTLTENIKTKSNNNCIINLDNYKSYDTLEELIKIEYNDYFKPEDITITSITPKKSNTKPTKFTTKSKKSTKSTSTTSTDSADSTEPTESTYLFF